MKAQSPEAAENQSNIIVLPSQPAKPKPAKAQLEPHFKIRSFKNASGTESWRVDGYKRDGTRVRQNFADQLKAQSAQLDLESEYMRGEARTGVKATTLNDEQLSLAEAAVIRLPDWRELPQAVEHWIKTGRQTAAAVVAPKLDEAVTKFKHWLKASDFRDRTKANLRTRIDVFANSVPNLRVSEITPDTVFDYLDKRGVAASTKDNDRRALSRFFGYCMDRGQKWITSNPARKEKRERRTSGKTPSILPLDDCETILRAAEKHRNGRLAPYVSLCLFGGLRPFEAARLRLDQINLGDGEIRLEPEQTKTNIGRVVAIGPTLKAWLEAYKGKPVYPANWRKDFDLIKAAAGYGNAKRLPQRLTKGMEAWKIWPDDVLRHTAISHYFRNCGSYGLTAEWAGNSEGIIKKHYQGRVSTEDTNKFYAIMPKKGGRK